ncbi:sulfatase [Gaetbulibacter aquiaggeris]|uniref:Sulfatase n=1 Tax=Gaetbulibacter aquiaggeris TaxID=1735373 RepID=A0ABW7ML09_9FLAO
MLKHRLGLILIIVLQFFNCYSFQKIESLEVKPNVLIIYPDQLRRYSAGFWSESQYINDVVGKPDPVLTPNIDKIAKKGVVFTNAISNFPLCSPARGMLLSGMYPEQNGIWNNCRTGRTESLKDDIPTITDLFFQAGYNTAYFGKCHWLKNDPLFDANGNYVGTINSPGGQFLNTYDTYVPPGKSRHHIEYFYQSVKDDHFSPMVFSSDPNTINGKNDGELHLPKAFTPKIESEKIIQYLKNDKAQRDSNKPFFIMWSINPPHNPWDEKNTDMEMFHKYYDETKVSNINSLVIRENVNLEMANYARYYYANVTSIDRYIGMVLDELEKMGVLDNTIVILSSDHGEMLASHGKEGKNTLETEALAVPFIIHWPKGLEGGKATDVLFSVPDVLPTTMALAGLRQHIPGTVQGIDFSKKLFGIENDLFKEPEGVLIMLNNSRGIHSKNYTLCLSEKKSSRDKKNVELLDVYLYDNIKDPYQLKKIPIEDIPEVANKLLRILGKELKRTNDPWYNKAKHKDIIIYPS